MGWADFFAMGSYGVYVWSAYALAAVVLILNVVLPLRRRRSLPQELREYYRAHRSRDETSA